MVPACIQHRNTGGGPSTHPQAQAQAVALLTGHLLEQANSMLQKRATNLMPAQAAQGAAAPAPQPTRKTYSFRVRVFNPDCKKQYDTLMLRDIAEESVSSPLDLKKRYGSSLEVKSCHRTWTSQLAR